LALRRSGHEVDVTDTPSGKAPVSVQELIQRIKTALPEWKQFKLTRDGPVARQLFGDYYTLDLRTHIPILGNDIEKFARDLGVRLSRGRHSNGKRIARSWVTNDLCRGGGAGGYRSLS
jgi:hypothetical protein